MLWPGHCKPLFDELLSSWLVRLADANGLQVHDFMGSALNGPLWTNDIDMTVDDRLLNAISERTSTPLLRVRQTTLEEYKALRLDGNVPGWILSLGSGFRKRKRRGLQACPACLNEQHYFRRDWRIGFIAACNVHRVVLTDRCGQCERPLRVWQAFDKGEHCFKLATFCHSCKSQLMASGASASAALLGVQATLRHLSRGDVVDLGGRSISKERFFRGLRSLAALVVAGKRITRVEDLFLREKVRDGARRALDLLSSEQRAVLVADLGVLVFPLITAGAQVS